MAGWRSAGDPAGDHADPIEPARRLGPQTVVVTLASQTRDAVSTLLVTETEAVEHWSARQSGIPNGAGDLCAGLLLGHLLRRPCPPRVLLAAIAELERVLAASAGRPVLDLAALGAKQNREGDCK